MTPEGIVKKQITDYINLLEEKGFLIHIERREAVGANYKKGIPDLYGMANGYHIEIEVKKPGGKLSTMQEKWRDKFKRLKVHYILADNLDEVKRELKEKYGIFLEN